DELKRRFPQHPLGARCELWIMTAKGITADPAEAWQRAALYAQSVPPQQKEYTTRESQIVVADVLGRASLADSARRVLVRARADRTIDPREALMGDEARLRDQLG